MNNYISLSGEETVVRVRDLSWLVSVVPLLTSIPILRNLCPLCYLSILLFEGRLADWGTSPLKKWVVNSEAVLTWIYKLAFPSSAGTAAGQVSVPAVISTTIKPHLHCRKILARLGWKKYAYQNNWFGTDRFCRVNYLAPSVLDQTFTRARTMSRGSPSTDKIGPRSWKSSPARIRCAV